MPSGVVHTCPGPSAARSRLVSQQDHSPERGWSALRNAAGGGTSREACLPRTSRGGARGRGHVGGGAAARGKCLLGGRSASAASRHGAFGTRLLAQLQKAAGDSAAPKEKVPEPEGRRLQPPRAAGADASPRRLGGRAAPPPLPGRCRQNRRSDRGPQEPFRPPGQPAAGRRGGLRRAAPQPPGGAELGECLRACQARGCHLFWWGQL